jgi:flagellar hook-associated protein 2
MDTGSDATLAISATTTLAGFSSADFSTTQTNQDALLKVDGWPSGTNYITRDSNSIDDLIDGVTLNLRGKGPSP